MVDKFCSNIFSSHKVAKLSGYSFIFSGAKFVPTSPTTFKLNAVQGLGKYRTYKAGPQCFIDHIYVDMYKRFNLQYFHDNISFLNACFFCHFRLIIFTQ